MVAYITFNDYDWNVWTDSWSYSIGAPPGPPGPPIPTTTGGPIPGAPVITDWYVSNDNTFPTGWNTNCFILYIF